VERSRREASGSVEVWRSAEPPAIHREIHEKAQRTGQITMDPKDRIERRRVDNSVRAAADARSPSRARRKRGGSLSASGGWFGAEVGGGTVEISRRPES
jgi:hypothetical protein